jgi:hypothetical protein
MNQPFGRDVLVRQGNGTSRMNEVTALVFYLYEHRIESLDGQGRTLTRKRPPAPFGPAIGGS